MPFPRNFMAIDTVETGVRKRTIGVPVLSLNYLQQLLHKSCCTWLPSFETTLRLLKGLAEVA